MVLCTVAVLPHPSLPGFKGEVCYSITLTVAAALDVACRQGLSCLLTQYCATFEFETLHLLPRDYWRLTPLVDEVPSHEGIQDDIDVASFCETDETLVETTRYLDRPRQDHIQSIQVLICSSLDMHMLSVCA
jgi:hypothetical protein